MRKFIIIEWQDNYRTVTRVVSSQAKAINCLKEVIALGKIARIREASTWKGAYVKYSEKVPYKDGEAYIEKGMCFKSEYDACEWVSRADIPLKYLTIERA